MAVFGSFWGKISYLGVKFPVLKPLLGQKTGRTQSEKLDISRVMLEIFDGDG